MVVVEVVPSTTEGEAERRTALALERVADAYSDSDKRGRANPANVDALMSMLKCCPNSRV